MKYIHQETVDQSIRKRVKKNKWAKVVFLTSVLISLFVLAVLLIRIGIQGLPHLNLDFIQNLPSRKPEIAGIKTALVGSIWLMGVVSFTSLLVGVGTAVYLEEYAKKNKLTSFIQLNISNLAGVPSIVFGLLGLTVFVRYLSFGTSVIAAGLTMSLLILPIIIVSSQEAIRAVPSGIREASYAMGATKWQTISRVVLPSACASILTGVILALSRAVGETAPLVVLGLPLFLPFLPSSLLDSITVLPMQIYNWTSRPQVEFHDLAAAGIIVLLLLLMLMNLVAIVIRNKFQRKN